MRVHTSVAAALLIGVTPAVRIEGHPTRPAPLPRAAMSEPSLSPDRREIAFVAGGDIWVVPASGGEAHLLVSNPAYDSRPLYSPDGTKLAFLSTRTGNGDIYVLTFATGEATRLTFDDANELVTGWSADSKTIYFQSSSHELAGVLDVFRVAADGGTARKPRMPARAPSCGGNDPAVGEGAGEALKSLWLYKVSTVGWGRSNLTFPPHPAC